MQTESLKGIQTITDTVDHKELLAKVSIFLDQLSNDITVRNFEAEQLEEELSAIF